ncbi:MAG: (2Fe-2S)-binding protein [Clostridiaceae bacterium]|nr:(2Fe-2S)-binding protein [Clostridiaceae bacterium]HZK26090.1 (2Fe-2S)-binding protein [Thermoclostridium sp.]
MRIKDHPILDFERNEKITFTYNGQSIEAYANESIAAALHASGIRVFGHGVKLHQPRGLFCAIGNCSSCFMTVDGVPNVRICTTYPEEGMVVEEQVGRGVAWSD